MHNVPSQLLDLSMESMISRTEAGAIQSWNLAAASLYGWLPHEALGRDVADILPPYPRAVMEAVERSGCWEGELLRAHRDGTQMRVRARIGREMMDNQTIWLDVSRLLETDHPAERALAASEYRYRNLFGAVAASFWELDFTGVGAIVKGLLRGGVRDIAAHLRANPDIGRAMMRATRIVDANERSQEMFGPASGRMLRATPLDMFWPEESTPDFIESIISALSRRPRHIAETRMRAMDGRLFDVLFTVSFLPGSVGHGNLLIGFIDISDRVQTERRLGEVTVRRQMMLDVPTIALSELSSPEIAEIFARLRREGIDDLKPWIERHPDFPEYVADQLRFVSVNDAAVRLFGADSDHQLVGRSLTGLIAPGCEIFRRSIIGSFAREPVYQAEVRMRRLDGRPFDTLFCRVSNPDPNSAELLLAQIDISEQALARQEIERMRLQVAHASRIALLGQLTTSIVHEVSQPATAIAMHAAAAQRIAARPDSAADKVQDMLAMIGRHASRLSDIIARLRDTATNQTITMRPLAMDELVSEARQFLQQELSDQSIKISVVTHAPVPVVIGDRVQLQQVLTNLIMNAVQAMRAIPPDARLLDISVRSDGGTVLVSLSDSGEGLPAEFADAPFRAFQTSKPDGLGVGLTICQSIAERHGGSINIEDRTDAPGVIATLRLPAALAGG